MDDRLYTASEKAAIAKANEDEGGKEQRPILDVSALISDTPENQTKEQDLAESDDLVTSIKLGEFVRDTSNLARAHEFSRTNEPELGMS